jgi:hypothetical protein
MFLQVGEGTSQSAFRVFVEKQGDEGVDFLVFHVFGELQRVFDDFLINLQRVLCVFSEGHKTSHELIDDDT